MAMKIPNTMLTMTSAGRAMVVIGMCCIEPIDSGGKSRLGGLRNVNADHQWDGVDDDRRGLNSWSQLSGCPATRDINVQ